MPRQPRRPRRLLASATLLLALTAASALAQQTPSPPGTSPYLTTPEIPGFRFEVTIDGNVQGHEEGSCIGETLCVSGALPGRSELFVRVIGPRPNGYLWVQIVRFTPSAIDLSIRQQSSGATRTYHLAALAPNSEALRGLIDKEAFRPPRPGRRGSVALPVYATAPLPDPTLRPEPAIFRPPEFPDYRFTVRIFAGSQEVTAHREAQCLPETACVSGALPGRSELFLRIIGPRPNGFLQVNLVRFSPSRFEVEIERLSTGETRHYVLAALPPSDTDLTGRLDRHAFPADDGIVPDPGPGNDRTLAGIDSNHDGVRDDVERLIEINFAGSPDSIAALRQGARAMQRALVDTATGGPVASDADDSARALECVMAVRPSDGARYYLELVAEMVDTDLRLDRYLDFNEALSGLSFTSEDPERWLTSCSFTPANAVLRRRKARLEAEASGSCGSASTTVFYLNGVLNGAFRAMVSESVLAHAVSTRYPALRGTVTFRLSYNQTHGLFDLIEALHQISPGSTSTLLRIVFGLISPPSPSEAAILSRIAETAAEAVQTQKLQRLVEIYRRELIEGRKVVLVAHSQGNLYANRAYDQLQQEYGSSVGIVSVATPDSRVAGGGPWFTLTGDRVIRYLRLAFPSILPPDLDGPSSGADRWQHGFLESYLQPGGSSRVPILRGIDQRIDDLEPPQGIAHDGVITVTLTWGAEPDVDLHVFEPGGRHVYYAQPQGDSGYLDVDDTTSFGPEHYYVSCDTLVPGTYRIGVNYYRGDSPETALIEVKAGLLDRPYTVSLPVARGPAGNDSPIRVARIVVTRSQSGEYQFQVLSGW